MIARRAVLQALVAGSLLGPVLAGCADGADEPDASARHPVLVPPKDASTVLGLDLNSVGEPGRKSVLTLLQRIDDAARSGTMVGFGASLFDRAGVPALRPHALTVMPPFIGDLLDPARTHGDLMLQIEADDVTQARARADDLLHGLTGPGGLTRRWQINGTRAENQVRNGRPLLRNPFGYTEGHGNQPVASAAAVDDVLVTPAAGQPDWIAGSSLLAVRVVQLARELWADEPQADQDRIIGRHRDGTWLDGRPSIAEPAFATDPDGAVTPLDSHVRSVNPRTASMPAPRMMRRSWAYTSGRTGQGQLDEGILFMAYQADYRTGFARAQSRLATEAMAPYLLAVGGGYFAVPARRPPAGWRSVLEAQ